MPVSEQWKPYLPVRITTFGGLSFSAGENQVRRQIDAGRKLPSLLAYLLLHPGRAIPISEILEAVWPDSESDDPAHAFKTLVYRVRNMMKEDGIPYSRECIIVRSGTCRWNPELPYTIDAEEFERCYKQAILPSTSAAQKRELLTRAVSLYRGDFLPRCAEEEWIVPVATYYHSLYLRAVLLLIELLDSTKGYAEIEQHCRAALDIEPYDEELHYHLIRVLANQSQNRAALDHYQYANELLLSKLGVTPSARLRELSQQISAQEEHSLADIDTIRNDLRESEDVSGIFVCDYVLFRQIYRLQSRLAERQGVTMYLVLITLTDGMHHSLSLNQQNTAMKQLLEIARETLRKNDVVARYSSSQYVLMLPAQCMDNAQVAVKRVIAEFERRHPRSRAIVNYTISPLSSKME